MPDEMVFWSENHVLMFLGSIHLYNQWLEMHGETIVKDDYYYRMEALLRIYLHVHVQFNGFYETNSHVYLPYTLTALLNLIDFSHDPIIQTNATILANLLVKQLMLTTSDKGVATLAVSSRAFPRTRERIWGHNVNNLTRLFTGQSPMGEAYNATHISNFICTTKWIPELIDISTSYGYHHFQCSHKKSETISIYEAAAKEVDVYGKKVTVEADELIPFYWSAGLLVDKHFIRYTKHYQKSRKLGNNVFLKAFSWILTGEYLFCDHR